MKDESLSPSAHKPTLEELKKLHEQLIASAAEVERHIQMLEESQKRKEAFKLLPGGLVTAAAWAAHHKKEAVSLTGAAVVAAGIATALALTTQEHRPHHHPSLALPATTRPVPTHQPSHRTSSETKPPALPKPRPVTASTVIPPHPISPPGGYRPTGRPQPEPTHRKEPSPPPTRSPIPAPWLPRPERTLTVALLPKDGCIVTYHGPHLRIFVCV